MDLDIYRGSWNQAGRQNESTLEDAALLSGEHVTQAGDKGFPHSYQSFSSPHKHLHTEPLCVEENVMWASLTWKNLHLDSEVVK